MEGWYPLLGGRPTSSRNDRCGECTKRERKDRTRTRPDSRTSRCPEGRRRIADRFAARRRSVSCNPPLWKVFQAGSRKHRPSTFAVHSSLSLGVERNRCRGRAWMRGDGGLAVGFPVDRLLHESGDGPTVAIQPTSMEEHCHDPTTPAHDPRICASEASPRTRLTATSAP